MITALLYHVQVKHLSKTKVEITLVPSRLGRLFKRKTRVGIAFRAVDREDGCLYWWWATTDRFVGNYIEGYIAAAPILQIEDMSVEQLLLPESPLPTKKGRSR